MGNCQTYSEDDPSKLNQKSRGRLQLIIKSETWLRDSYGLFDYENTNMSNHQFKTYASGRLIRSGTDVSLLKENDAPSKKQDAKDLLNVSLRDGNFWISSPQTTKVLGEQSNELPVEDADKTEGGLWVVAKSLKAKGSNKGYQLNEGDYIKLGRVKLKIIEVKKPGKEALRGPDIEIAKRSGTEPDSPIEDQGAADASCEMSISYKGSALNNSNVCRICLSEHSDATNPLFTPCKCSGTMKFVHVKCLQTWLRSKLYVKDLPQVQSFYLKSFECELCKTLYPNVFEVDNVKYDVVEIDRPNTPYMILEVLSKEGNMLRGLHVVKMDKKNSIRLGRGHDSDIRITDISVSRFHALINLDKDGFYLEDNDSKFGTLIYMKAPFAISGAHENISVQAGRTVLSFSVKRSWRLFSICIKNQPVSQNSIALETQPELKESPPVEEQNKPPTNIIQINERPIMIVNRRSGFGVRSNRGPQGPQRPLGGDDDMVEMEEGASGSRSNRSNRSTENRVQTDQDRQIQTDQDRQIQTEQLEVINLRD